MTGLLQSWYNALEKMRFALPDEDAREKAAGQSWPIRIERLKDAALAVCICSANLHLMHTHATHLCQLSSRCH